MLEEILRSLKNWFQVDIYEGEFTVSGGTMAPLHLADKQYYRICGSLFNDGLHRYGDVEELTDETFTGTVWALAIPQAMLDLSNEITAWQQKHGNEGAYTSESFGGYSYSKAVNAQTGQAAGWQDVFRSRLNQWRRVREL